MMLYPKRKAGFHNMRPELAHALSRRGTRSVVELADDYAYTYAPFIQAAVREVGHNYRQVAKWLTRERIPAQRNGPYHPRSRSAMDAQRSRHHEVYARWQRDPEGFWGEAAQEIDWIEPANVRGG
jgi:Acetyl-coenzyme A synthetase N-terminus